MDDPHARPDTRFPLMSGGGKPPDGMSAEERARWMWQMRVEQLAMAEARAFKRFAWAMGIHLCLLLLIPLGLILSDGAGAARIVGLMLQGFGVTAFWLVGILVLLLFIHWLDAMSQRRRFHSAPGTGPRQVR